MIYTVWEVNQFNTELKNDIIAKFTTLEHARLFCDCLAGQGLCNYAVYKDDTLMYPLT